MFKKLFVSVLALAVVGGLLLGTGLKSYVTTFCRSSFRERGEQRADRVPDRSCPHDGARPGT